jgi:hypothetical protein
VWAQAGKHRCFSNTDPDSLGRLSGHQTKALEVFVEDDLGVAVVSHVASELGMSRHVRIIPFGAAKNCFTVFAGLLIKGESCENSFFILDGDEYETAAKKQEQINAACSGNDEAARSRREKIAARTRDFILPAGIKPERFIHGLIIAQDPQGMSATEKEIHQLAVGVVNPMDTHDFVDKVVETLGDNRAAQLARLIPFAAKKEAEWKAYTQPIRDWLVQRKAALNLP